MRPGLDGPVSPERPPSSPSSRRGFIAASRSEIVRLGYGSVVPVITAGLHCGAVEILAPPIAITVVPVITAGLHCGG